MSRHRCLRVALPVVAVLGLSGVLSACSGVSPDAMTIDGKHISRDDIRAELDLRSKALGAKGTTEKYDAVTVTKVLNDRLLREVFNRALTTRKLTREVPSTDLSSQIQQRLETDFGGAEGVKKLPGTYRDELKNGYVTQISVYNAVQKALGTPEAYFKAHAGEFGSTCLSHLLVATEAEAAQARARIAGGEPFAAVAKAVSSDTGSASAGGDLGCGDVSNFVAPFAKAAATLKINELSQPVETQFGFHILKVTKRGKATFAEAKSSVEQRLDGLANQAMVDIVNSAKITVNPSMGVLQPGAGQEIPRILTPGSPISATASTVAPS